MRYRVDLRSTYGTWPERRAAMIARIEGSSWLHDVMLAAGEAWPFNADSEYGPDEPELCCAAEMLSQLSTAPDEAAWRATLEYFSSLLEYDRVEVIMPEVRRLSIVR